MEFIECEKIQGVGYCSDNECSCTLTQLSFGGGYVYISPEVVDFRRDALTLAEVKVKLEQQTQAGEYISVSKYAPILVCEIAAQKRNLDMAVSKADAQMYWREGRVPLRATPWAKADDPLSLGNMFSSVPNDEVPFANVESKPEKSVPEPEIYARASELKNPDPLLNTNDKQQSAAPAPRLTEASVDDVMAQYSSGPLAEFAKKMAQEVGGTGGGNASYQEPLPDTVVTKSPKVKQIVQDEQFDTQEKCKNGSKNAKKEKIQLSSTKKSVSSVVLTVLAVVLAVAAIGVITVVVIVKLQSPKTERVKAVVVEQKPQIPEIQRIEIGSPFFDKSYDFEDANCKGVISFAISDDTSGRYTQLVRLKVNEEKTYTVRGKFTYTPVSIVFRPDSYKKDIQWVLDEYDQQGSVVFRDPSEPDFEKARVYLKISNPQGN